MPHRIPKLTTDAEARFEFGRKDARVNMRLPQPLLEAVKTRAAAIGVPYQRFIRQALEAAVGRKAP